MLRSEVLNQRIWKVYLHVVPKEISEYEWDKYYVGLTALDVQARWRDGKGYRTQQRFYNAICKYGWENMVHIVLKDHLTADEAYTLEELLIQYFNSTDRQYGYNVIKSCEEAASHYGQKLPEKTRQLISQNHADFNGINNPNHKIVYQFTKEGKYIAKYGSAGEAERITKIPQRCISRVARGKNKTAHGYIWVCDNNVKQIGDNDYIVTNEYYFLPKRLTKKKVVVYDEQGNYVCIYDSAKEAGPKCDAIARGSYKKNTENFYNHYYKGNYYFYEEDQETIQSFLVFFNDGRK